MKNMSVARFILLLGTSTALIACTYGSSRGEAPTTSPAAQLADAAPVCKSLPLVGPPDEAFKESPIYVGNEMPADEVGGWARLRPGFQDMWIDRDHGGWIVVAFSSDAAARQAELAELFPGAGVVAFQVGWRKSDLERLQERVSDELRPRYDSFSVGIDVMRGRVAIGIGVLSPDRIDTIQSLIAGEPVCVEGSDPSQAIPEGPQPTGGDGWRLLASQQLGQSHRTAIAADTEAYGTLWQDIGLTGEPPVVDFQAEVVIWFGAVYGSSCPDIRLDDVVSDRDRQLVHGTIVLPSTFSACTADANPHAFVVALERSLLPPPPFALQLDAEDPPAGAPEERTIVDADLRVPGSVARPGDVHLDARLPEPHVVEPGSAIETGFEQRFRLDVRCGIEWLGPLNDYWWRTDGGTGGRVVPDAWQALVDDGSVIVSVLIETDPGPTLTATAGGHSVVYLPTRSAPPACAQDDPTSPKHEKTAIRRSVLDPDWWATLDSNQ